jgi:hypothetical protein
MSLPVTVIPAKAGTHGHCPWLVDPRVTSMDPRLRGGDEVNERGSFQEYAT